MNQTTPELLREGIKLDEPYIGKIESFASPSETSTMIDVFRPPGDTTLFLGEGQ